MSTTEPENGKKYPDIISFNDMLDTLLLIRNWSTSIPGSQYWVLFKSVRPPYVVLWHKVMLFVT